jgi:glycine dehydrogenase subunit 2
MDEGLKNDAQKDEALLFELSTPGRGGARMPALDVPESPLPDGHVRDSLDLPQLGELDVVRHFTRLSRLNMGIDTEFYPLGSCTMKYNPKANEDAASLRGFTDLHPLQDEATVQGAIQLMYELQAFLGEISGLPGVTLQPAAGAHGELTGMFVIAASHRARGDEARRRVLIPDSAHGTNPATATMTGYAVTTIATDARGNMDMGALRRELDGTVAALMMTNPNTLGLFEEQVLDVTDAVHQAGGLVYCDGANMNALLGIARPGDLGMDVLHLNLHKTFSTPHGGGGPGAGATAVREELSPYLPVPIVVRCENPAGYRLDFDRPLSVGRVRSFHGNFLPMVKAYAYIRALGAEGLREVAENAVLNANYLLHLLEGTYDLPFRRRCQHEFVLSGARQLRKGVRTLDIAKRLLDFGFHPPTVYFPAIVKEALMIEPTETESKRTLDAFAEAMIRIAEEVEGEPQTVRSAPHTMPVGRLDEVGAARHPRLRWQPQGRDKAE